MNSNTTDNKDTKTNDPTPQEVLDYFLNNSNNAPNPEPVKNEAKGISIPLSELEDAGLAKINNADFNNSPVYKDDALIPPAVKDELFDASIYDKSNDTDIRKIFTDLSKITITDEEKENYLRILLDGTSRFTTTIRFNNINFHVYAVSKTIEEQDFIRNMAIEFSKEVDSNNQPKHMVVEGVEYLLKLNVIFTFPGIFEQQNSFKETVENGLVKISKMNKNYWFILINALRIFEQKEVLLGELMSSGDF